MQNPITEKKRKSFFILDFGASLQHTHHYMSIQRFTNLLESFDARTKLILPFGSQLSPVVKHQNTSVIKILFPSSHEAKLRINLGSVIAILFRELVFIGERLRVRCLIHLLFKFSIFWTQMIMILLARPGVVVVFPTACPKSMALSLNLVRLQERFRWLLNIEFLVLRFTNTSENRGKFSKIMNFETFQKEFSQLTPSLQKKFRFGYEIESFKETWSPAMTLNAFYSPYPSAQVLTSSEKREVGLRVGFLGNPRASRRLDTALSIIREHEDSADSFGVTWVIQTSDLDLGTRIEKFCPLASVDCVFGTLTFEELTSCLRTLDFLVILNDPLVYENNSSAMAYLAADYEIPVIVLRGSGFAKEVELHNIGLLLNSSADFVNVLNSQLRVGTEMIKQNIRGYNRKRSTSNLDFLGITPS